MSVLNCKVKCQVWHVCLGSWVMYSAHCLTERNILVKINQRVQEISSGHSMQLATYMEGCPLMWMMPLHLHVNKTSDYDYDMIIECIRKQICP